LLWLLDLSHDEGVTRGGVAIEGDFHVVNAKFGELDSGEEIDVGGVGIEVSQLEIDFGFSDHGFVIGSDDLRGLLELADPVVPAGPDGELEQANWSVLGGDDGHDPDEGLDAVDFLPNVFADDGGLKGRNYMV